MLRAAVGVVQQKAGGSVLEEEAKSVGYNLGYEDDVVPLKMGRKGRDAKALERCSRRPETRSG